MSRNTDLTRRGFLKGAAAAALAAPYVIPADALGLDARPSPSNRICVAGIGTGGRGSGHMRALSQYDDVELLAVCDVDKRRRLSIKQYIDKRYEQTRGTTYAGCDDYADFREVLDRPDIDAVVIGTPDHWHAPLTTYAAKAGKDIYCEKPMSNTIAGGRKAADAVKRYGRVFQTGSQERSRDNCRYACELVRNGYLGKIHTIRTFLPKRVGGSGCTGPEPIPDGFDYDMWLGPRPVVPYHHRRCHGSFRWVHDYSDGERRIQRRSAVRRGHEVPRRVPVRQRHPVHLFERPGATGCHLQHHRRPPRHQVRGRSRVAVRGHPRRGA